MTVFRNVGIKDGANLDAFSRLRVSQPENLFNVQCQYNKATIQMESGATGTGVTPAHSADTRMVKLSATSGTGTSFMQSYSYIPYQPGKSQEIAVTFVLDAAVANTTVDVGYFDANNGIFLRQNGTTNYQIIRRTKTSGSVVDTGANAVAQADWNIDTMLSGTGPSGKTIDLTKAQILIIDLQFLGMGRVRVGFDIDGVIYYVHEFKNANSLSVPYMQTGSLPVQMLLTATTSGATKDAYFKCAAVHSEGGNSNEFGYLFATPEATETAASGSRTHILSIRPKTTFNSIENRQYVELLDLQILVTGANPVYWELVVGATVASSTWADVSTTYSGVEYTSVRGAFTNLTNGVVVAAGYSNGAGTGANPPTVAPAILPPNLSKKIPISLNRAGAVRDMGTYTLLVTGIGGTSACRASINYKEIR